MAMVSNPRTSVINELFGRDRDPAAAIVATGKTSATPGAATTHNLQRSTMAVLVTNKGAAAIAATVDDGTNWVAIAAGECLLADVPLSRVQVKCDTAAGVPYSISAAAWAIGDAAVPAEVAVLDALEAAGIIMVGSTMRYKTVQDGIDAAVAAGASVDNPWIVLDYTGGPSAYSQSPYVRVISMARQTIDERPAISGSKTHVVYPGANLQSVIQAASGTLYAQTLLIKTQPTVHKYIVIQVKDIINGQVLASGTYEFVNQDAVVNPGATPVEIGTNDAWASNFRDAAFIDLIGSVQLHVTYPVADVGGASLVIGVDGDGSYYLDYTTDIDTLIVIEQQSALDALVRVNVMAGTYDVGDFWIPDYVSVECEPGTIIHGRAWMASKSQLHGATIDDADCGNHGPVQIMSFGRSVEDIVIDSCHIVSRKYCVSGPPMDVTLIQSMGQEIANYFWRRVRVTNNILVGSNPIWPQVESTDCVFDNNTCLYDGSYAMCFALADKSTAGHHSSGNVFSNNTFVGTNIGLGGIGAYGWAFGGYGNLYENNRLDLTIAQKATFQPLRYWAEAESNVTAPAPNIVRDNSFKITWTGATGTASVTMLDVNMLSPDAPERDFTGGDHADIVLARNTIEWVGATPTLKAIDVHNSTGGNIIVAEGGLGALDGETETLGNMTKVDAT